MRVFEQLTKLNPNPEIFTLDNKLGYVVRMVVDSILPHAESGPNDHRKVATRFKSNKLKKGKIWILTGSGPEIGNFNNIHSLWQNEHKIIVLLYLFRRSLDGP